MTDTPGLEDFDRLRPQMYDNDLNAAIICFDITQPGSFQNVVDKWTPEIKYFCPGVPIILGEWDNLPMRKIKQLRKYKRNRNLNI